ncbi:hypothetical protein ACTNEO_01925 [Gracilibacillus sp. HCP3S3_G5_1]|uniref:hypothetical protein n=1 Tax=unclassified Gracilibacillus TaxID=2625209 RepID=UPI003F89F338
MSHNEDDLIKELNKLKTNAQLDPYKKESIKKELQQHAKKKRAKSKTKHTFIWLSTAAAVLICGVLVYTMITNDQITLPADDNEQNQEVGVTSEDPQNPDEMEGIDEGETPLENEPTNNEEADTSFSIEETGTDTTTIVIEGNEEATNVTNFLIEPYGIHYQIDELLSNYTIENNTIRHYSDENTASITLSVEEGTPIETVAEEMQTQYDITEDPEELPATENSYVGLMQHSTPPPQGYYLYQIDDNVLIIQYEYDIEAGDGIDPRLGLLRQSIE